MTPVRPRVPETGPGSPLTEPMHTRLSLTAAVVSEPTREGKEVPEAQGSPRLRDRSTARSVVWVGAACVGIVRCDHIRSIPDRVHRRASALRWGSSWNVDWRKRIGTPRENDARRRDRIRPWAFCRNRHQFDTPSGRCVGFTRLDLPHSNSNDWVAEFWKLGGATTQALHGCIELVASGGSLDGLRLPCPVEDVRSRVVHAEDDPEQLAIWCRWKPVRFFVCAGRFSLNVDVDRPVGIPLQSGGEAANCVSVDAAVGEESWWVGVHGE